MIKQLIVVAGQPNSGKTTAIRFAYGKLAEEGKSFDFNPRWDASELKLVLLIDGAKIGFASSGDAPDRLERTLRFLFAQDCDVIVCAARLNRSGQRFHPTIDVVKRLADEHGLEVDWIDKRRSRNEQEWERDNLDVADKIVCRIRTAIGSGQLVEA